LTISIRSIRSSGRFSNAVAPELDEAMRREHERLGKLIRQLGITADGA
jgi:hypothetical protein